MSNKLKDFKTLLVFLFCALLDWSSAFAEDDPEDDTDYTNYAHTSADINHLARDEVSLRLKPLGFGLMGDSIDEYTGTLVFNQTDVSIPGNSDLEVAIRRIATTSQMTNQQEGFFGDWILDVPNISSLAATPNHNALGHFACVGDMYEDSEAASISTSDGFTYLHNSAYWDGMKLNIPGQGSKILLGNSSIDYLGNWSGGINFFGQSLWDPFDLGPEHGGTYSSNAIGRVTKDHWVITCINPRGNPYGGESEDSWNEEEEGYSFDGYIAISPDGTRYRMDKLVIMPANDYTIPNDGVLERNIGRFYATEVTDVHGNWVRYDWSSDGKLERIHSNDGREIVIAYYANSSRISSVSTNSGRSWNYSYQTIEHPSSGNDSEIPNALYRVIQPDGKYWEYNLDYLTLSPPISRLYSSTAGTPISYLNTYVKHPYGVRADYEIGTVRHAGKLGHLEPDSYRKTYSVFSKTLSGPSIPTSTWSYDYEQYYSSTPFPSADTKTTTVTRPDGSYKVIHYYRDVVLGSSYPLEGKAMKEEVFSDTGVLLEETNYTYEIGDVMGREHVLGWNNSIDKMARHVYLKTKVVTRDGDTYTTEYEYNTDQDSADYSYHKPTSVKTYSNVSTTPRETVTDYTHKKDNWVLSLPETVTINNRLTSEYGYNDEGLKTSEDQYGFRIADYTYHSSGDEAGLLASMTDANNNTSYWHDYYRGAAEHIERPDGLEDGYVVDANGWPTDITDYAGYTTSYEYDNMGRVTKVIPSKTQKNWVDTNISYAFGNDVIQTITRGDLRETITYDTLFRSVEEQKYDFVDGTSIYTATEYDAAGRRIFQSFPSAFSSPNDGTDYEYDGLGRVTQMRENVTPYATTDYDYLSNHRRQVTDPSGAATTYSYSGYDSSGRKELLLIEQPLNVTTQIYRNVWGERTGIRQFGSHNGYTMDETQSFHYDSRRRLCGYYTPEGGYTNYAYDNAGRMTSYQPGSSSFCATPSGSDLVTLTYDDLDRVTLTNYADTNTPDISKTYDANGNVLTVDRGGVNWTYTYDELNQITSEQLDIDDRNYDLAYEYNTYGNMISRTLPSGRVVDYSYDGFGRVTDVESDNTLYASYMTYHPNNVLEDMNYGNGQIFSQTLNARLQPDNTRSDRGATTALDLSYTYDVRGDITAIDDGVDFNNDRDMDYDDLGRLVVADGVWGDGSFEYDPLGNIRRKELGSRVVTINYDGNNRATQSTDTAGSTRNIYYDNRGNVTTLGALSFVYDGAQQPIGLSGSSSGSYTYDGNLKRVKAEVDGKTIYNVYDASGTLVYIDNQDGGALNVCLTSCGTVDIPKTTDYLKAGGMTIARISNGNTTYLHPDHLGSPQAGTDENGDVLWREQYTPYGEKVTAHDDNNDLGGYTGHISDSATGLTYMQARYYDPAIGRFLNIDPVGFKNSNPMMFNRYAYANNNPYGYTDPDGRQSSALQQLFNNNPSLASEVSAIQASIDTNMAALEMTDQQLSNVSLGLTATSVIVPSLAVPLSTASTAIDTSIAASKAQEGNVKGATKTIAPVIADIITTKVTKVGNLVENSYAKTRGAVANILTALSLRGSDDEGSNHNREDSNTYDDDEEEEPDRESNSNNDTGDG